MTPRPVALVTGAGSGIGRATAQLLAQRGYAVALAARTEANLRQTAERIGDAAPTLVAPADVTDAAHLQRLVDDTVRTLGGIDALVNNAGYAALHPLAELTADELRRTLDVNLAGPMLLTALAWKHLATRGGIVVNVSSLASLDPFPGLRAYGAAKAGLNLFTRGVAAEGLRAVAILPGAVETPMLRGAFDESTIPRDKALPPQTVAEVIVDCVTGRRAFDNGTTLTVASPP